MAKQRPHKVLIVEHYLVNLRATANPTRLFVKITHCDHSMAAICSYRLQQRKYNTDFKAYLAFAADTPQLSKLFKKANDAAIRFKR